MSRVIDWSKTYTPKVGNLQRGINNKNSSGSMKESFVKSYAQLEQQEKAEATLRKALPVMQNILLQRMVSKSPIKVTRPLPYTTEALGGMEAEEDDGFYMNSKQPGENAVFKSITKVIPAGTELTFMQLEKSMNQLWFKTDKGQEIGIYVDEQSRLLTQTDIADLVMNYSQNEKD